ncbi:hypothetical protein VR46_44885 [Streptomyces sp. NRRL S-444]|nr:hypothetical protein VR46_44885 [Streptomyces sp. NRRL S-444]
MRPPEKRPGVRAATGTVAAHRGVRLLGATSHRSATSVRSEGAGGVAPSEVSAVSRRRPGRASR